MFFRVFRVPERCTGIFKLTDQWTHIWNKMTEEKACVTTVMKHNSKEGLEKNCAYLQSRVSFVASICLQISASREMNTNWSRR